MLRSLIILGVVAAISGCGGNGSNSAGSLGSANPVGWFKAKPKEAEVPLVKKDPRAFIEEIVSLKAEPTTGGIILKASGKVPYDGYHSVSLASTNNGFVNKEGGLVFEFRGFLPETEPTIQRQRTITVARYLSHRELANVNSITVQALSNSRTLRP